MEQRYMGINTLDKNLHMNLAGWLNKNKQKKALGDQQI